MPGWPETIFILVIVILLFGAKKLPELARGLGQSLGEFKKARDEFEREVRKSSAELEVKEPAEKQPHQPQLNFPQGTRLMRKVPAAFLALSFAVPLLGKEIVVASYNVENYLLGDRQKDGIVIENAPKPEQEIAAVVKVLSQIQPDIVGLIEIGDESMLEDLQQRLKPQGSTIRIASGSKERMNNATFACLASSRLSNETRGMTFVSSLTARPSE